MADHAVSVELYYDAAWNEALAYIRSPVKTRRGVTRSGQSIDPASANATLDNDSGNYAPLSIVSPLRGKIGQNTPARVNADGVVQLTGEVAAWVPDESVDGNDAWTDIDIAGVLQRIGRGTDPLYSALRRSIESDDLTPVLFAYWPMNDPTGAVAAASGTLNPGIVSAAGPGADMRVNKLDSANGVTFGTVAGPVAGESFPQFIQNSAYGARLEGQVGSGTALALAAWQFECIFLCDTDLTAGFDGLPVDFTIRASTSIGRCQVVLHGEGRVSFYYRDLNDDIVLVQPTSLGTAVTDGVWHHLRVVATQSTVSTFASSMYLDGVLIRTDTGYPGVIGSPNLVRSPGLIDPFNTTVPASLSVGHVAFYSGGTVDSWPAVYGYLGETAAARFSRILAEEDITATVIGSSADSVPMGAQRALTLLGHLDEISLTDDALIFETRNSSGLTMRTGLSLQGQSTALTISREEVVPPLRPVVGDVGIRNEVTAQNPAGVSRKVVQVTGPRNIKLPAVDPQGVGRYSTKIDVNPLTEGGVRDAAGWRVNIGTYDGAWFAVVTIDVEARAGLTALVDALEIGDQVLLADLPVQQSPEPVPHIILGIENDLGDGTRRLVRLFLMPAAPYQVGILAATSGDTAATLGHLDSDGSTTSGTVAAGATSFTVSTPAGPLWTTVADDFPFDVLAGGQRVSISAISGATSPQTFTVQTSGRQVVYPIAASARVTVHQPMIPTQS